MMYLSAVRAQVKNFTNKFNKNECGVTAIAYSIVAAGVSAVIFTVCSSYGGPVYFMINDVFTSLQSKLTNIIQS